MTSFAETERFGKRQQIKSTKKKTNDKLECWIFDHSGRVFFPHVTIHSFLSLLYKSTNVDLSAQFLRPKFSCNLYNFLVYHKTRYDFE